MHECKGFGACLLISTIKSVIRYRVNRNRVDLYLQGSGNLCMCGSQTDWNTVRIFVFLDDLLMYYQAFDANLM